MYIKTEITYLEDFDAWSGAVNTKKKIIEANRGDEFLEALEDAYPEGIEAGELNDLLWFEPEVCYEYAGLNYYGVVPITADEVIGTYKIQEAIDVAIDEFIHTQKVAYGIEYTKDDFNVDDTDFESYIEEWLKENQGEDTDEYNLADRWLSDVGYEMIEDAITNEVPSGNLDK